MNPTQRKTACKPIRLLISLILVWSPTLAIAAIQDYQIIRLVAMKSDCVQDVLQRKLASDTQILFHMRCKNTSHYPDGVLIACSDPEYASSCVIQTPPREFNFLEMLQNSSKAEGADQ